MTSKEDADSFRKSSSKQTAFNIVNNYVGMTLLSLPFCSGQSGWLGSVVLMILSAFCAYTGWLVVQAYAIIVNEGRIAPSYAQLGHRCLGVPGKWLVLCSSTFETFVALPGMFIGIWKNAVLLFGSVPQAWVICGCIILSFPANWLRDFTMLSSLSFLAICSIVLVCLAVGLDVVDASGPTNLDGPPRELANFGGLPMAVSIMMAGLTGHVVTRTNSPPLPPLPPPPLLPSPPMPRMDHAHCLVLAGPLPYLRGDARESEIQVDAIHLLRSDLHDLCVGRSWWLLRIRQ